jgi:hypothetical protein
MLAVAREEHVTCIFRFEAEVEQETSMKKAANRARPHTGFLLGSLFKPEDAGDCSSETYVDLSGVHAVITQKRELMVFVHFKSLQNVLDKGKLPLKTRSTAEQFYCTVKTETPYVACGFPGKSGFSYYSLTVLSLKKVKLSV